MANKTIYVSKNDEALFEEAQKLAGEALSSVIARSLREFVSRTKEKKNGMKEIGIKVGSKGSEREQRFVGMEIGKWQGLSDDKEWFQNARIFSTSKGNVAVLLTTISRASLITDPDKWHKSGAYLENANRSELFVADKTAQLKGKIATDLLKKINELVDREEKIVEYLDI